MQNRTLFIAHSNQPPSYPSMSPFSCDRRNVNLVLNSHSSSSSSSVCSFFCNNIRIVFNLRRLSNLSCRIPIWQGSECEWIVCVCACIGRGEGGDCKQCMVGNGVLWSRLTVLPFCRVTLWVLLGVFVCFSHVILHSVWWWMGCVTVKALSRRHSIRSDSDYKGFM